MLKAAANARRLGMSLRKTLSLPNPDLNDKLMVSIAVFIVFHCFQHMYNTISI